MLIDNKKEKTFLGYLTHYCLFNLLSVGSKRQLQQEDLGHLLKRGQAEHLNEKFAKEWEIESKKPVEERSLFWAMFRCTEKKKYFGGMFLMFISVVLQFGPIVGLYLLVKYFEDDIDLTRVEQLSLAVGIAVTMFIAKIIQNTYYRIALEVTYQLRTMFSMAVFHKSLKLNSSGRSGTSTGQIMNLIAKDVETFTSCIPDSGWNIFGPITIIACVVGTYLLVGWSTFVGMGLFAIVMPANGWLFGKTTGMMMAMQGHVDSRLKTSTEVFGGMKVMKLYCWEKPFKKIINDIREKELSVIQSFGYIIAWALAAGLILIPVLQPVLVFFTYVKTGHELTAAKAFTVIALFNMIKVPLTMLPPWVGTIAMVKSAFVRLHQFLVRDTIDETIRKLVDHEEKNQNDAIQLNNAEFSWIPKKNEEVEYLAKILAPKPKKEKKSKKQEKEEVKEEVEVPKDDEKIDIEITDETESIKSSSESDSKSKVPFALKNLNLNIQKGETIAVIGGVGSGKSSLIQALLGEMDKSSGDCMINGKVAYVPQKAWILSDTVTGNIVLGDDEKDIDNTRLTKAVDVCALRTDVEKWSGGMLCEIGSRGVNLSGGQKARISLARAVYSNADVYLLDDPLSAVDSHVGLHLLEECIIDALKEKTVVLVTNALQYLQRVDRIVVMDKGEIIASGSYEEILKVADRSRLIQHLLTEIDQHEKVDDDDDKEKTNGEDGNDDEKTEKEDTKKEGEDDGGADKLKSDAAAGKLKEEEKREKGAVDHNLYKYYAKLCGTKAVVWIFIIFSLSRLVENGSAFWLTYWAKDIEDAENNGLDGISDSATDKWLYGYCGLVFIAMLCLMLGWFATVRARIQGSRNIHQKMLSGILRSPMSFFDKTPLGRITNRFSADMSAIDSQVPMFLSQLVSFGIHVVGQLAAVVAASYGLMAIPLIPLIWLFSKIQHHFRCSNTEVARLQSVIQSPYFSAFGEVLDGTDSIRASHLEKYFVKRIQTLLDNTVRAKLIGSFLDVWLHTYLGVVAALLMLSLCLIAIACKSFMSAGLLGLSIVYLYDAVLFLGHITMLSAKSESLMNHIERAHEFIVLPSEAPASIEDTKPAKSWPSNGEVVIKDLVMGYANGPDILHGINLSIKPAEKVGIVGRTGAGKSSFLVALFRLEEPRNGSIVIDGVDICKIGLNDLRSKLAIIPQEPMMFSGSVRMNVDPFNQHSDEELWSAFEKARLKDVILNLPEGLEEKVSENGDNFSVGQRQLICLVRALLRNPKVLMLDEATGSVDAETDSVIQQMIREQFKECTVITIAHRLDTIVDSDRILVLDAGNVAEYDTPAELLKNDDSIFRGMIVATGAQSSQKLMDRANGIIN